MKQGNDNQVPYDACILFDYNDDENFFKGMKKLLEDHLVDKRKKDKGVNGKYQNRLIDWQGSSILILKLSIKPIKNL